VSLQSAVYVGHIRHRRRSPAHAFTFPLFMVYLDLAELDAVFSLTRLWGRSRFCPAQFRREDYLSRGGLGLDESVRNCVQEHLGFRPTGPVRMLTHLRYFGFIFNPVTFYYCFDQADHIVAIVAEITNTPWRERHVYALDTGAASRNRADDQLLRWRFDKDFHVSPFLPMDMENDWAFTPPGGKLVVHMNLRDRRRNKAFDATLLMRRREMTPGLLRGMLVRYPLMTARVIAKIHFEALKLWLKRAPVFRHPGRRPSDPTANPALGSPP
jgi:DUF1365 family protein